MTFGGTILGWL